MKPFKLENKTKYPNGNLIISANENLSSWIVIINTAR